MHPIAQWSTGGVFAASLLYTALLSGGPGGPPGGASRPVVSPSAVDWASLPPESGNLDVCKTLDRDVGLPEFPADPGLVLRCRDGYALGYSEARRVPLWVAEHLTAQQLRAPVVARANNCPFAMDSSLAHSGHQPATLNDYAGTVDQARRSYDRGHMAPAADMLWSANALRESCLLSNMAPQQGVGMNRHIWAELERLVRDWACSYQDVYVVTGPIYEQDPPNTLGANQIHVPTAFFKLVYKPDFPARAVAFVMDNVALNKQGQSAEQVADARRVPVKEVEARTGLQFFTRMAKRERTMLSVHRHEMLRTTHACK